MSDTTALLNIVREYQTKRDRWTASHNAVKAGLMLPDQKNLTDFKEFVTFMDDAARKFIAEMPPMTPLEWESLLELLPNVRKILGMVGGEGGW